MLLRPPQQFNYGEWPRGPRLSVPVGLLAIGSFLKDKGIDVHIYDCFVEGYNFKGEHLIKKNRSRVNLTQRWRRRFEDANLTEKKEKQHHFGANWDKLRHDLETIRPDVVGITNLFRENTEETIKAASLVREVLPNAVVAVGGPNATAQFDYMLERTEAINIIGIGDGEFTMLEIIEWVQGKRQINDIKNIVYRGPNNSHIRTSTREWLDNLDELGEINYDLIKLERYFSYERNGIMARNKFAYAGAERSVSLVTSRGCPYKCCFCSIHIHAGRKYRRYSIEHTLNHLETLIRKYKVKHIHFEDDNLTLDRTRFMKLMNGVIERGLKFTWDTPNGIFANTLNEEMLDIMKRTGCIYLIVGVESGDQWVLDNVIHKQPLTIEKVLNAFRLGKKAGIDMHAFYIIGFPRETLKQIHKTLYFAMEGLIKYDVIPHMAIARADPGTALYEEASDSGTLMTDHSVSAANLLGVHSDAFIRHMINTKEFSPEELEGLNEQFHKKAIRVLILKTFRYLLRHPMIALQSIGFFIYSLWTEKVPIRDALVKLFFCRLFYRNALLQKKSFE
jgi:radical SAM superfamily enzyme YgiQ (UPF0313 family)